MAEKDNITKFYCYAHRTADTNHVFYIGKGHGNRAYSKQRSKYWHNKANKHGHIVEIIASNLTERQAFDMEREFISFYGRDRFVNLTDGGEGASGSIKSQDTKDKIGKANKGRKRPDMTGENSRMRNNPISKEKVRLSKLGKSNFKIIGENNPSKRPDVRLKKSLALKGVPKSEEHIKKLSISNTGKKLDNIKGGLNPMAVSVKCIESGISYDCIKYAVDWLKSIGKVKACDAMITRVCTGRYKKAYGYTWKYV